MKKLFVLTTIIAGSLIASNASAQVFFNAHVGFRVPGVRVYASTAPAPVVVYQQPPVYQQPAPVYQEPAYQEPAPVYDDAYAQAPAVCEDAYPGYVYYNYPAWNGHYRDRFYYAHYRPYFERDYRGYFHGRTFDHGRYEHDFRGHGGWDHGNGNGWGHYRR